MGMTRDEVIEKLTDSGFSIIEKSSTYKYTVVEHRGEPVGSIYDDSVYLAQYYPSLNPDGVSTFYADAKKTIIMFSHQISELENAIQWLLDSPNRIDIEKRQRRIDTIHRYFDERRNNGANI